MANAFKDVSIASVPASAGSPSRANAARWGVRIGLVALLIAGDVLLIGNKVRILQRFGYQNAPALPLPDAKLSTDDKALYWAYALYDRDKIRSRFHVEGDFAVNRALARHNLEGLLPQVATTTLGEISTYGSVAFHPARPAGLANK